MAKIVEGIALLAVGIVFDAVTFGLGLSVAPILIALANSAIGIGASLVLTGIAQALAPQASLPFSVRSSAAARQLVYGQVRVSGAIVYISTTNSNSYLNTVIAWAAHPIQSIDSIYIDGRLVIPSVGTADGSDHTDVSFNTYNFHGEVLCQHSLGTVPGTYLSNLGSTDSK